jgi:hypothetical protein
MPENMFDDSENETKPKDEQPTQSQPKNYDGFGDDFLNDLREAEAKAIATPLGRFRVIIDAAEPVSREKQKRLVLRMTDLDTGEKLAVAIQLTNQAGVIDVMKVEMWSTKLVGAGIPRIADLIRSKGRPYGKAVYFSHTRTEKKKQAEGPAQFGDLKNEPQIYSNYSFDPCDNQEGAQK